MIGMAELRDDEYMRYLNWQIESNTVKFNSQKAEIEFKLQKTIDAKERMILNHQKDIENVKQQIETQKRIKLGYIERLHERHRAYMDYCDERREAIIARRGAIIARAIGAPEVPEPPAAEGGGV